MTEMNKSAIFSHDRKHRYTLTRNWGDDSTAMFIGLNPSTADEFEDDPTIRRCIAFAKSWGYGTLVMTNIFSFRATNPKVMKAQGINALGDLTNQVLINEALKAQIVIAAWGTHGGHLNRQNQIFALGLPLFCLGKTKEGYPKHPLYLRSDCKPQPFHYAS